HLSELAKPIRQAVEGLEPGGVSAPVELSGYWNIFYVTGKKSGLSSDFLQKKDQLIYHLRMEDMQKFLRAWLSKERNNHKINISSYQPQQDT
ncbi:MAG: peptidylprolyl isomerase, partial [Proteobacteria bacterium]|nr:peptidylprolyl isomerase [Pseudomonadota bacterium]